MKRWPMSSKQSTKFLAGGRISAQPWRHKLSRNSLKTLLRVKWTRWSDRELEILELIGKGNEVPQIAKTLHLSPKTVETHRAHIKEKLNLANARQVARFAVQWVSARGI